jgi:hypothetical protein
MHSDWDSKNVGDVLVEQVAAQTAVYSRDILDRRFPVLPQERRLALWNSSGAVRMHTVRNAHDGLQIVLHER